MRRAFGESALRRDDDNAKVRKWTAPVRLGFFDPSAAPNLIELSKHGVRSIAAEAGIAVTTSKTRRPPTTSCISTRTASAARPATASRGLGGTRTSSFHRGERAALPEAARP